MTGVPAWLGQSVTKLIFDRNFDNIKPLHTWTPLEHAAIFRAASD
ncbi:hypothetical protein D3OALGB2SA_5408 [Olavius algarvensis associated proteobacterium Delta 3]|nr:hypothetical protein D3OALGB2SA_5408 [Olavius algarvensis associated proteobacterium Delta 3]